MALLAGAMAELKIGDPMKLDTDIGPVIDGEALAVLEAHAKKMGRDGRLIAEANLSGETKDGFFFAPRAFEIDAISRLEREVFGPILHVVRFEASALDDEGARVKCRFSAGTVQLDLEQALLSEGEG